MIPLSSVQVVPNGQPADVFSFTPTSKITELEFRSGSLHLRHTKETSWPSVALDTAQQQATFWVLAQISGQWVAAGMERLRPNQQDKPEGSDRSGFIAGFVEGRNFGAFNGHTFQPGDRIGFMVVQGDTRLNNNAPLRERSLVVEMAFPPSGEVLWEEGQPDQPAAPQVTITVAQPAAPAAPAAIDLQPLLDELNAIKAALANVATKDDIREARNEFINSVKAIEPLLNVFRR